MIKVFGIGNPLLGDDGVGVRVARELKKCENLQVYLTEIFVEDALDQIKEEDYIVIIDAVDFGKEAGEVFFCSLNQCVGLLQPASFCHERNLLYSLLSYYPCIKGEFIGIQIAELRYEEQLSDALEKQLNQIISKILKNVKIL